MRRKQQKQVKRGVEFFQVQGGFRKPYKIILDGNFVHTALGMGIELKKRFLDMLQINTNKGPQLIVTQCILNELQSIGPDFAASYSWLCNNALQKGCSCDGISHPDECIKSYIDNNKGDQFFVATQDRLLREALGDLLSVATIFLSVNGMHLTPPSEEQIWLAKQGMSAHLLPSEKELQHTSMQNLGQMREPLQTSSNFRKKKKKGNPNPLSVKSKQNSAKTKRPGPRSRRGAQKIPIPAPDSDSDLAHIVANVQNNERKAYKKKQKRSKKRG